MYITQKLGCKGERIAVDFLLQNGFCVLHTNWHYKHKELDIIAVKENVLHIVEVKTQSSEIWKKPKDSVVHKKQNNIIEAANAYIEKYNINLETQFDIISITTNSAKNTIEFITDAFTPNF